MNDVVTGNPIRVAYVVGDFVTGGVKSYLLRYLNRLNAQGFECDIIAYEGVPDSVRRERESAGNHIFEVSSPKNPIRFIHGVEAVLRDGSYDIVHGMLNTLNPFAMCAASQVGVPVRIAQNLSTGSKKELKSAAKLALRPFARMGATDLSANSRLAARWLYGREASRSIIFKNPVELPSYRSSAALRRLAKTRLGIVGGPVFGWVGRMAPQKNPLFLIDVFRAIVYRMPSARLLVIGYGPMEREMRARVAELELDDSVIWIGGTEDLVPLYHAMDVFLLPSLYEGLPVVGIEAQAAGLPCVFSSEVTDEVRINSNVKFIGLEKPVSVWADESLDIAGQFCDSQRALRSSGHDADDAAVQLANFYRRRIAEAGRIHD